MTALRVIALATAIILPAAARAAEALPILAGRWSTGDCARSGPDATRWFGPGTTASFNDRCRMTAAAEAGGIWRTHLACRYRAARDDTADVVIEVLSPRSLRWIDQCTATGYRFCGSGDAPTLAASR